MAKKCPVWKEGCLEEECVAYATYRPYSFGGDTEEAWCYHLKCTIWTRDLKGSTIDG